MKTKLSFIFLILWLASGCIVAVNSTLYRYLSNSQKEKICEIPAADTCQIIETNATELRNLLGNSQNYNLVVLWLPSCNSNLRYVNRIKADYQNLNLKVWLVAESYLVDSILKAKKKYNYTDPVFIIDHKYGQNVGVTERKFIYQLCGYRLKSNALYRDTIDKFLFYRDSLLAAGSYKVKKYLDNYNGKNPD